MRNLALPADLVPEEQFASMFPSNVTVNVTVPSDSSAGPWGLAGQTLQIALSVRALGRELKEQLSVALEGMPVNKQQVRCRDRPELGFLKDTQSLASLNIGQGAQLEMSVRSRGGKK